MLLELINKVIFALFHKACANGVDYIINTDSCCQICLQLKSILMAIYFAGDHVVWASQAGVYTNKEGTEK